MHIRDLSEDEYPIKNKFSLRSAAGAVMDNGKNHESVNVKVISEEPGAEPKELIFENVSLPPKGVDYLGLGYGILFHSPFNAF